jgi:hypothetical protein
VNGNGVLNAGIHGSHLVRKVYSFF